MKYHNLFIYLWLILAVMSLSSCLFYMRDESQIKTNSEEDEWLIKKSIYRGLAKDQYIVLRKESEMWHLFDMKLSANQKTFTAKRENVSENYQKIINHIKDKKSVPYAESQKAYINQVHFHVNNYDYNEANEIVTISLNDILKLEMYQHNTTHSNRSTTAIVILVSPVVTAAGLLVAALIICNCPYVYSEEGNLSSFEGNLFTGSIYPPLERMDYIPLSANALTDVDLKLTIANENEEILNINQLSLLTVKHEPGVKVLIDQAGIPHTISNPFQPIKSTSFNRYDHTDDLLYADGLAFDFGDPEIHPISKMSEIDLVFDKKVDVDEGKLILKVKNNNWGGFIHEEVSSMLGRKFEWFHKKAAKRSHKEMKELMRKDGLLMSVSIFRDGSWQPIDYIWPMGSKAYKEVLIPIDLQNIKGNEIRIKLEAGFKFWDIDHAAMDFSEDLEIEVFESFAESNDSEFEKEILAALRSDDQMYMNHLQQGEMIDLQFNIPEQNEESTYSYFLKGKGFYSVEKDYENRMRIGELLRFRREGGFSYYSYKRFNDVAGSIVIN